MHVTLYLRTEHLMVEIIQRRMAALFASARSLGLTPTSRHLDVCPVRHWDRSGLEKIMGHCVRGTIPMLVVEAYSQLTDNAADLAFLLRWFHQYGTCVFSLREPVSSVTEHPTAREWQLLLNKWSPGSYRLDLPSRGVRILTARVAGPSTWGEGALSRPRGE